MVEHPKVDETNWPARIQRMPRYRGLPRLYTAIEVSGVVDFATTDMARWIKCITEKRCGVCGAMIHDSRFFAIGGPQSHRQHAFFDPPMHRDCATWSFENCPYIVGKVSYRSESRVAKADERLVAAGGLKMANQDVADTEVIYLLSGSAYSGPHQNAHNFFWLLTQGFRVEREHRRKT